jgi:hypothetical protein
MQWANLKIKEGLAYLSLDLIHDLKGQSQKLFRENIPLIVYRLNVYDCFKHKR